METELYHDAAPSQILIFNTGMLDKNGENEYCCKTVNVNNFRFLKAKLMHGVVIFKNSQLFLTDLLKKELPHGLLIVIEVRIVDPD
jgi:hypothetical protein